MDLDEAARALLEAKALLIAAGAGMGVDSGLPDFRGDQGFWRAYPPYERLGLSFTELANPEWFEKAPVLAWGFYGHRLELYRRTVPHEGFALLRSWGERMPNGAFVFTSNVDGQFQRAGFREDVIHEVHGAIDWMQCMRDCGVGLFRADPFTIRVDEATMRAAKPIPACPKCGSLARPNILMFGDSAFDGTREAEQRQREAAWLETAREGPLVVIECGAGTAVPTVRRHSDQLASLPEVTLIRLNLRQPEVPRGHFGFAVGAREGLRQLDARLRQMR